MQRETHRLSLAEATRIWARIAALSFGGPAGQIAVMHRILVDEKRWIGERRFLHALNFCMLLPGPEAQQLAVYIGWLLHGTKGGLIAGGLFVLPGAVAILVLSWIYVLYGKLAAIDGLFYGLKAAVLVIVVQAVLRVGRRALANRVLVALAAMSFVALFALHIPFPYVIVAAGLAGYAGARMGSRAFDVKAAHGGNGTVVRNDDVLLADDADIAAARPSTARALRILGLGLVVWFAPLFVAWLLWGDNGAFVQIGVFFAKIAVVTFGGAYAVLAYVAQQAVETFGWLSAREMLDGLGLAETTPGPLIMVTQFVGFLAAYRAPGGLDPLVAATLGAMMTTWVTFVPCFIWIFLGAPYIERLRQNRALSAALAAITAAVVGVILNLAIWFALHVLFGTLLDVTLGPVRVELPQLDTVDPVASMLAVAAAVALFRFRTGVIPTLLVCALAGMALRLA
jgi:chromate transporter